MKSVTLEDFAEQARALRFQLGEIKGQNIENRVGFVLSPDEFYAVLETLSDIEALKSAGAAVKEVG